MRALIHRIDVRDYHWDRPIDRNGDGTAELGDGWSAIVEATGPYAVRYSGAEPSRLEAATETAVPFLPAHALVHAVSAGELYYGLIDVRHSLDEHWLELGADLPLAEYEGTVRAAGFVVPRREVLAMRIEQSAPNRAWWGMSDQAESDAESPFDSPTNGFDGPPQFIFHLPNGLQAYAAEDRSGPRRTEVPLHEYCQRTQCATRISLAACHACHDQGLLPVRDQVRDVLVANLRFLDAQSYEEAMLRYVPSAELDALIETDNRTHRVARAQLFEPSAGPDPLSRVALGFELDPLGPARAAAELGVPLEVLQARLPELDPRLAPLGGVDGAVDGDVGASVDRTTFTETFLASLCALSAGAQIHPADCAADAGVPSVQHQISRRQLEAAGQDPQ